MRTASQPSFTRVFGIGFVLGAIGLVALQPAEGRHALVNHFAPTATITQR